jgi:hypothetical protein
VPSSKQRKRKGPGQAKTHLAKSKKHTKAEAKLKAKREKKRVKKMLAQMERRQEVEATRRRVPPRGAPVVVTAPIGSIGHFYDGTEFLGKSHATIHTAIKTKVLTDLQANTAVLGTGITCAIGLNRITAKSTDKDFIEHLTDLNGRTTLAIGRIAPDPTPDAKAPTPDPISGINTTIDDRGHLVPEKGVSANAVHTANTTKNVVAENWLINQHYKKAMEDTVKQYATAYPGKAIHTMHQPKYSGTDLRPSQISHFVVVDGVIVSAFTFDNKGSVIEPRAT